MDKELIREGKIALISGVLLYLGATIAYNLFIVYILFEKSNDLWWILFLTSIFGVILIVIGIHWIIEGWVMNEKTESENS